MNDEFERMWKEAGVVCLIRMIRSSRMGWAGRVERMENTRDWYELSGRLHVRLWAVQFVVPIP
jgi:hypothetical protein